MNERFKELAKQSTVDIKDEFGHWINSEFDKEKFAQMIIFECTKIAVFNGDKKTGQLIKDFFEVTE